MPSLVDAVLDFIDNNPQVVDNENKRNLVDVLRSRDESRIKEAASNVCKSQGVSEEDMAGQVRRFFNL